MRRSRCSVRYVVVPPRKFRTRFQINMNQPSIDNVKAFWEQNPLGNFESPVELGSREFFCWHDKVREEDEGQFASHLYEFDRHVGENVLDIGCGNGWLVTNFARKGALIHGIDLTEKAIELTRKRLAYESLSADLRTGNAEQLPFENDFFDYVTSAGVLHHTPNTPGAIHEAIRVTKPGGRGMISLYYKHLLLQPGMWILTRLLLRLLFRSVPGRNKFPQVREVNDLIRMYDGNDNPIGKAYNRRDVAELFQSVRIERIETHFFPTRFLLANAPYWLRALFDRIFGLMIYVQYRK